MSRHHPLHHHLRSLRTRLTASSILGLTTYTSYQLLHTHFQPTHLDSASPSQAQAETQSQSQAHATLGLGTKLGIKRGGGLNPKMVRQVSAGSLVGILRTRLTASSILGLTTYTSYQLLHTHFQPTHLDSASPSQAQAETQSQSQAHATLGLGTKLGIKRGGGLNPKMVRQVSAGSLVGLGAGLAVSTFSRSLALIIGLLIVGLQWASSHGLNLIPTSRMQRYLQQVNMRSVMRENVALKVSFGTTFALAAFMRF
ncbi:hypothetical protein NHQ30_001663 [Ciborinia camelliae]|nr:hypothetical protein NHQ30_001663 [Ciborinia camelliae]